jgi:hypothetical protein
MKKHILTIRNGSKVFTFMVAAPASSDGKARISRGTMEKAMARAGVTRGECILIG